MVEILVQGLQPRDHDEDDIRQRRRQQPKIDRDEARAETYGVHDQEHRQAEDQPGHGNGAEKSDATCAEARGATIEPHRGHRAEQRGVEGDERRDFERQQRRAEQV